jgi:membrane associated rhomboid family serine protease
VSDAGTPDRYGETGGWPPPGPDQRRYEPGPDRAPDPAGVDPDTGGWPVLGPGGTPTGRPAGEAPPYGTANGSPYGPPTSAYDPPAGSPGAPWAPGDSAFGRLGGQDPAPVGGLRGRAERRFGPPNRGLTPARVPAARRPRSTGTPVTFALIAACVFVFLLQEADDSITYRFGLLPVAVTDGGEWYRLVTAAFLHAGLAHLATNMLSLYIVGTVLERVLGAGRYLALYFLSALGGSLLSVALAPQFSLGVGASGAIFGLFGALLVLRREVGATGGGLLALLGINLVITFTIPNIAWQAHIGGLVAGLVVAAALLPTLRARRR